MNNIPGLESYDLNIFDKVNLNVFEDPKNFNKIFTKDDNIRKVKTMTIKDYDEELDNLLKKEIGRCLEEYKNKYALEINSYEEFIIVQYSQGGHYSGHVDDEGWGQRLLSMVLYINDDYDGGELEFTLFDGEMKKIKPKKNQLLIFPSNYVYKHIAHPVDSGKKYIILSFFSKYKTRSYTPYTNNYELEFDFEVGEIGRHVNKR